MFYVAKKYTNGSLAFFEPLWNRLNSDLQYAKPFLSYQKALEFAKEFSGYKGIVIIEIVEHPIEQ